MNKIFLPLASLAILAAPIVAHAAPCRDAHGRFTTCTGAAAKHAATPAAKPQHATAPAARTVAAKAPAKRCKINGRFASCSAPGAKSA